MDPWRQWRQLHQRSAPCPPGVLTVHGGLPSFGRFHISSFTSSYLLLKATFCSTPKITASSGGTSPSVPVNFPIGLRTSSVAPGTNSRSLPKMLWGQDASVRSLKQRHMGKVGHKFINKEKVKPALQKYSETSVSSWRSVGSHYSLESSEPPTCSVRLHRHPQSVLQVLQEIFDKIQVWATRGYARTFP